MNYVQGEGNPCARLMIVGEAPGQHEENEGRPFVGPTGAIVDECLRKAGTSRSEVYLTNVVKVRPPNNDITRLSEIGVNVDQFLAQLWAEIKTIQPNCILALGNIALKALTGCTGIQKYRGSILANNRSVLPKVVPSIHPASLLHKNSEMMSWRDLVFIQFDFDRAVRQSQFSELRLPERNLFPARNSLEVIRFFERHINAGKRDMTLDVETCKTYPICVALAFNKHEAISIPLFNIQDSDNPTGIPMHDMAEIWKTCAEVFMDRTINIIGHNMKFDEKRVHQIGLDLHDVYFDTQLGFHVLYPELPKKLQFVSSVLTEEPYYKDELTEYDPRKHKLDKLLLYNARDAAVTFEVYEKEVQELKEIGMLDWYFERMHPLHRLYSNLENRGIAIDLNKRKWLQRKYDRYIAMIQRSLARDVGHDLNVMSPKQVAACLFGELKCPLRHSTDETTLQGLMLNAVKDDKRRRIIRNILKGRKARKTKGTYIMAKLGADKRMHTQVNITGTESGRTSTSKVEPPVSIEPEGLAFQTLTKHGDIGADLRLMFVVDSKDKVFIEPDLSQAEDRVVTLIARDEAGMAVLNKKNFIFNEHGLKDDRHTLTAVDVLSLPFEAITDEDRQIGKKTRHAGNYGMKKRRFSQMVLAESDGRIVISEWKAGQLLDRFHAKNPNIKGVFWEEVAQALQRDNMTLVSPHGRRRQFFDRWSEELLKQAYSYLPQASVSDHLKFQLLRIEKRMPYLEVLQESHDSFLAQIPKNKLEEAYWIVKEELETPIDFSQCSLPRGKLVIPCELVWSDSNWKNTKKYKPQGVAA